MKLKKVSREWHRKRAWIAKRIMPEKIGKAFMELINKVWTEKISPRNRTEASFIQYSKKEARP